MQAQLSLIVVNNCFYPSQVTHTKKINFLFHRSIYDNKVSCFISSFYCFCCVPILVLEKLVILIGSRAPIVSCATHFTILSNKSVCWAILWSFSWANISLFWRENGVGTHFEQQFFSFTQHQVPSISTV